MRILYNHRTKGKGVEGVHINGIINAFKNLGNEVDIVSPITEDMDKKKKAKFEILSKISSEILFEIFEILYNFIAYKKIKEKTKKNKYDFIYERSAFFLKAGMIAGKKYKIPYLLEVNYTTYTTLVRKRSKIFLPFARYIEKKNFMRADAIFVVSSFLLKQLINLGVPENKIYLTTNAVDEKIFQRKHINSDLIRKRFDISEIHVIGFVGGFYTWHGLDILLKAVKIVENKIKNICVLLVGDGPMKKYLVELAKNINISSKIIFTGMIDYNELPEFISSMNICVIPNTNNYGSPMKVFEYMAMGKPVVAPKVGPVEDVIEDRENGLLFNTGDIIGMANCLEKLLCNKELSNKISENAKNKIFIKHLWKNNAEKIVNAYSKIKGNCEQIH